MNFQLKALSLPACCAEKADALLVLLPKTALAGKDTIAALVAAARADGDLKPAAGQVLSLYRVAGVAARRVVLASTGEGKPRDARVAVQAAFAALKGVKLGSLIIALGALTKAESALVATVVQAAVEAGYAYSLTKSKSPEGGIESVLVAVGDVGATEKAFETGLATGLGINLAREWGNRPANHATPRLLAEAAKALTQAGPAKPHKKAHAIECKVLGPK